MTTTKKMSATAISDVDCTWISLVKRGANRQPIKIHKSENGNQSMKKGTQASLDLAQLGARAIKSEGGAPVLVAAIVKKGEGERIGGLLKEVDGLDVVSVTANEDNDCDVINLVDGAQMDENCIVYKHDDNVAFIVSGVKTTTQKMDFWANSTSFKENIQKTSFFPNMREAAHTLIDTIANIVYEGDDAEVAKKADTEVAAFGEYVSALVTALPVKVMKSIEALDFNVVAEEPKGEAAKADESASTEKEAASEDKGTVANEAATSEESDAAAASEDAPKEDAAKSEEEPKGEAAKADDATPAWALALVQKMDNVSERLNTVEQASKDAATKADEAVAATNESKALVEKADNVLSAARGTLVADAEADDNLEADAFTPTAQDNDDLREAGIESY